MKTSLICSSPSGGAILHEMVVHCDGGNVNVCCDRGGDCVAVCNWKSIQI